MAQLKKTPKEEEPAPKMVDRVQEAASIIKKDRERRETEAVQEYQQFLVYLKEKYNVEIGISQPQVIIHAL